MSEKLFSLKSEVEIIKYFQDWKGNINAVILNKTDKESISDYPDIEEVFEQLQKKWLLAFNCAEKNCDDYVELSISRDGTKEKLEILLKEHDLNL